MADVLITSEFFGKFSDEGRRRLTQAGHRVIDNPYGHKFLSPEEITAHSRTAEAFICDLEQINRYVIDHSPCLKIISRRGVGVDSVDVAYAESKQITVARTMGVVESPVSELVMGYILEFSRRIGALSELMHQNRWKRIECHSVSGKTLGIIGMGKIGLEVAKRAHAFGMRVLYADYTSSSAAENIGARKCERDKLLGEADFVTVHVPLTDETRNMFTYDTFCKMKAGAYLINTSRGAVVEQSDLARALRDQKIAGAAIDVYDHEPCEDSVLAGFDNVLLTPHVGTFTIEVFIQMDILAAENIIRYFEAE